MSRNNLIAALIVAAFLIVVASAQNGARQSSPAAGQTGRYQLVVAEHVVDTGQGRTTTKEVLRIDTMTGATDSWRYAVDDQRRLITDWVPIK